MRWMADNIFIRTDPAENIKADKEKSTEKIDGVIALIMALDRAIRCGNEIPPHVSMMSEEFCCCELVFIRAVPVLTA
ncbi:phage terminase, large subunit-like protein [Selenomonas sp. CM52]|nr:phage terminase, large subunit-like protein [Selenomonas sp. CM52]